MMPAVGGDDLDTETQRCTLRWTSERNASFQPMKSDVTWCDVDGCEGVSAGCRAPFLSLPFALLDAMRWGPPASMLFVRVEPLTRQATARSRFDWPTEGRPRRSDGRLGAWPWKDRALAIV